MVRRIVMLGIVGAVVAAAPASAFSVTPHTKPAKSGQLHTHGRVGSATSSRVTHGACKTVKAPPKLNGTCTGGSATVVYTFTAVAPVVGKPSFAVSYTGKAPSSKVKASGSTITVTVSVSGQRSTQISYVSVSYYA
jgi:hypothetical protein